MKPWCRATRVELQSVWRNKRTTDCYDLPGILLILSADYSEKYGMWDSFIDAIRPESGWAQQKDFNPNLPTVKKRPYGNAFYEIVGTPYGS